MDKREKFVTIGKIMDRYECGGKRKLLDRLSTMMDIEYSGVDTKALLTADDFTFFHDMVGIMDNMDRQNKKLANCFMPRVGLEKN